MFKIEELLQEEAFVKNLLACETEEQVKAAFKEKGCELSSEEFEDLKVFFAEAIQTAKEMSPEELEQISGGASAGWEDVSNTRVQEYSTALGGLAGIGLGAYAGHKWAQKAASKDKNIGTLGKAWGKAWRVTVGAAAGFVAGNVGGYLASTSAIIIKDEIEDKITERKLRNSEVL